MTVAGSGEPDRWPEQPGPWPPPAPGPLPSPSTPARPPGPERAWRARPYPQLLRGPGHRWWRPLLSLALLLLAIGGLLGIVLAAAAGYVLLSSSDPGTPSPFDDTEAWSATPVGLLFTLLVAALLMPAAMLATWGGFGWRPRWLSSVAGGLRWGWLGACLLIAVAITVVPGVLLTLLTEDVTSWSPEPRWPALVAVVVLAVPFQSAAEEYLFRGWILQAVGSLFAGPLAGALAGGAISSLLFALAHGQQDPWLFADRFVFGAIACWLVWRTGGLEAGIAFHIVNNLTVFGFTIADGGLVDALTATEAGAAGVVVDLVMAVIAAAVVALVARRRGVQRLFVPPSLPLPVPASG